MMRQRITLLFTILFLFASFSYAKQISSDDAKSLVLNTIGTRTKNAKQQELKLVYTAKATLNQKTRNQRSVNLYYVFNIGNNNGFIITSADDVNVPVIGRSDKGEYNINNLPENYKQWIESVELGMIKYISEGNEPSEYVKQKWNEYKSSTKSQKATQEVSPLLTVEWSQSKPYYNITPVFENQKTYTGCVATAMAQVMKYHEHPKAIAEDVIIPGYTTSTLGIEVDELTLTSNAFDWSNMTDNYSYFWGATPPTQEEEDAVAKLMYYCGVSVKMNYDTIGSAGSGAVTSNVAQALMNYFDYDKSIDYKYRTGTYDYTDQEWINLIKGEIDNQRPVIYSGSKPEGGGHAFICDGYNDNDEFHINWGWNGGSNGYFNINAPLQYTEFNAVMINIKPNEGGEGVIDYYVRSISGYPESVKRDDPFKLDCSITTNGIHSASTDYYIAIYDQDDNFVSIINFETYTSGWSMSGARCKVPATVAGGTYKIKAVLEQNDGTYLPIKRSSGLIADPLLVVENKTVMHNLVIRNYSDFTSTEVSGKAGDNFSVDISFGNKGGGLFEGQWGMSLADKDTQEIKYIIYEGTNNSLKSGYYYTSYPFYCKLPADVAPGNYKLMMCAKATGKEWDVVSKASDDIVDYISFMVIGDATGIDETTTENIKVYPNPVTDVLHIATSKNVIKALIYNTNGTLLIDQADTKTVNVNNLNKGIYILKVETEEGTSVHKINKQ